MILGAAMVAHATEYRAHPSDTTTNFVSPPAWEAFQLFDWHGRPKRLIGQDPRAYGPLAQTGCKVFGRCTTHSHIRVNKTAQKSC